MNRLYRSIAAGTTLAVLGSVAAAPLAALANTSADADASVEVNVKHPLLNYFGYEPHGDASTSAHVKAQENLKEHAENRMAKVSTMEHAALTARIELLNNLGAHIDRAKRLSADDKSALDAQIKAQLAALADLKAKADAGDESSTTLKKDMASIKANFHAFALAAPRAVITAAGERILNVVSAMETVSDKLETRIDEAESAGKNVDAAVSAHADFDAKVADAKVQAQAAIDLVANLDTEGADQAAMEDARQTLKDARAKIKAAIADLKEARKDLMEILKDTKGVGIHASSTTEVK
jgi:hypothetical protein